MNSAAAHAPSWRNFRQMRFWPTWLLFACLRACAFLPYRLQLFLGRLIGRLCHALATHSQHERARVVQINLARCFPHLSDAERRQLEKKAWQSIGMGIMETSLAWWGSDRRIDALFTEIQGLDHLEKALTAKQPVQILFGHFTTLELGCRWLGKHYKAYGTAKRYRNRLSHAWIYHRRCQYAQDIFFPDELKKIIATIRTLDPIVFLMDINTGFGVGTTFMGSPCIMSTINAKLAKSLGTQLIPMRCYRRPNHQGYGIIFEPPLQLDEATSEADVGRLLQRHIEHHLEDYPDQYLWVHRRFKHQTDHVNPYQEQAKQTTAA